MIIPVRCFTCGQVSTHIGKLTRSSVLIFPDISFRAIRLLATSTTATLSFSKSTRMSSEVLQPQVLTSMAAKRPSRRHPSAWRSMSLAWRGTAADEWSWPTSTWSPSSSTTTFMPGRSESYPFLVEIRKKRTLADYLVFSWIKSDLYFLKKLDENYSNWNNRELKFGKFGKELVFFISVQFDLLV